MTKRVKQNPQLLFFQKAKESLRQLDGLVSSEERRTFKTTSNRYLGRVVLPMDNAKVDGGYLDKLNVLHYKVNILAQVSESMRLPDC